MKKMKLSVIFILIFLIWSGKPANAETTQNRQDKKEVKAKSKQLAAEGWSIYGQPTALYDALLTINKLTDEGMLQIIGFGKANSRTVAIRKATLHATKQYATMMGTTLEADGLSEIEITPDGGKETTQVTYYANTAQKVKRLEPTLSIIRQLDNGTVEAQVFCLVNTNK